MKTFSVIKLVSTLPTTNVNVNDNFTNIVKQYDSSFHVTKLLPSEYQGLVYGWSTHLNIIENQMVLFILINPAHNFVLLKECYDNAVKLNQYGFNFDATNVNVNHEEYIRIFSGQGNGTTEFMFLEVLGDPTHL